MSILSNIGKDSVKEVGVAVVQPLTEALHDATDAVGKTAEGVEKTMLEALQTGAAAIADGVGMLLQLGRRMDGATLTVEVKATVRVDLAKEIPAE